MGLLKLVVVVEEAEDGDSVGETAVDVEASVVTVSEVGSAEEVVSYLVPSTVALLTHSSPLGGHRGRGDWRGGDGDFRGGRGEWRGGDGDFRGRGRGRGRGGP